MTVTVKVGVQFFGLLRDNGLFEVELNYHSGLGSTLKVNLTAQRLTDPLSPFQSLEISVKL